MRYFVLVLGLVFSLGAVPAWATEADQAATDTASSASLLSITPEDHVLGKADAPVTIIEYSSLSCPHCAHFHNEILPALEEEYIDTSKVKLVFRSFPLNAPALKASLVLDCIPEDKYYTYARVFYKLQEKWAFTENYLNDLKTIAKVGGMQEEAFDACVSDKEKEDAQIARLKEIGEALKIEATPTFFINGEKIQGASTAEKFREVIDTKLKEVGK